MSDWFKAFFSSSDPGDHISKNDDRRFLAPGEEVLTAQEDPARSKTTPSWSQAVQPHAGDLLEFYRTQIAEGIGVPEAFLQAPRVGADAFILKQYENRLTVLGHGEWFTLVSKIAGQALHLKLDILQTLYRIALAGRLEQDDRRVLIERLGPRVMEMDYLRIGDQGGVDTITSTLRQIAGVEPPGEFTTQEGWVVGDLVEPAYWLDLVALYRIVRIDHQMADCFTILCLAVDDPEGCIEVGEETYCLTRRYRPAGAAAMALIQSSESQGLR